MKGQFATRSVTIGAETGLCALVVTGCLALGALTGASSARAAESVTAPDTNALPAPVTRTAKEDHEALKKPLHITALRPGRSGSNPQARMAGNYLKYAGPLTWDDLPVDSHELVALCAPRPVFLSAGAANRGDGWVDAKGTFLAGVGAGPVHRLLGKKDMATTECPPIETLVDGDVAFRQHAGGHTDAPNWPTFLKFAERYLKTLPP